MVWDKAIRNEILRDGIVWEEATHSTRWGDQGRDDTRRDHSGKRRCGYGTGQYGNADNRQTRQGSIRAKRSWDGTTGETLGTGQQARRSARALSLLGRQIMTSQHRAPFVECGEPRHCRTSATAPRHDTNTNRHDATRAGTDTKPHRWGYKSDTASAQEYLLQKV